MAGTVHFIVGSTGAGKTTYAKKLAGEIAAVVTLFIAGTNHCTARSADGCMAFTRCKLIGCVAVAITVFPFWLRRKLRGRSGS